jgi:hypothetical protein
MAQLLFFAVNEDLLALLDLVDAKGPLNYIRTGNFLADEIKDGLTVYNTGVELPGLGLADGDASTLCASYLISERDTPINLRHFQGFDAPRVCIDQLINPDTVTFKPAGIWKKDILINGDVGTASDSKGSQGLMRRFQAAIKKTYTKVRAFYVGPKARQMLDSGKRLCQAIQSPPEYDLAPVGAKK